MPVVRCPRLEQVGVERDSRCAVDDVDAQVRVRATLTSARPTSAMAKAALSREVPHQDADIYPVQPVRKH